jgi:hypothetical protein
MVNLATLSYLPELQQWEAQIPRLEDGWWPTGGAVNPAADGGLMNWQAGLLANRTAFLKGVIDGAGLGAAAVPLVTLNSAQARLTGSYRFASGDANTPASGVAGTVEVIAASASAVNQMAFDSASSRMWTRFWNGSVWSAWDLIWSAARGSRSFGATMAVTLPDGTLFQAGSVTFPVTNASTSTINLTFPQAFPANITHLSGAAMRAANSAGGGWAVVSASVLNTTGATLIAETFGATNLVFNQTVPARWFALGN